MSGDFMKIAVCLLLLSSVVYAQTAPVAKPQGKAPIAAPTAPPVALPDAEKVLLLKASNGNLTALIDLQKSDVYMNFLSTSKELQSAIQTVKIKDGCKDITDKFECVK